MDFEKFAPARDLLYLSFLLLGAGAGFILRRWKKGSSVRSGNASLTAGLCFFSGAFAALTAAVILSNWAILRESSLYLPAGILAALAALAVRFPRAAGFPLVLAAGIFTVWTGYVCVCFPPVSEADSVRLYRDGEGLISVARAISPNGSPTTTVFYEPAEKTSALEVRARLFSFSGNFPLTGGVERGNITEILADGKTLYAAPRPLFLSSPIAPPHEGLFLSFWDAVVPLWAEDIPSGSGLTVFLDGSWLAIRYL